ncbi:MAG: hypothetical protein H6738_08270 [Alphaproteobacteria bacterium]|nr:hypothetical protein [Alphaproteobacteria bacterium]MCB9696755.1 hypothetical protein [Alphaproteobacteria bacterium]
MKPNDCEALPDVGEVRLPGSKLSESGVSAALDRPGDTWVTLKLDTPEGREWLGIGADARCCDGAFVSFAEEGLTVVLVELKGRHVEDAVAQLVDARRAGSALARGCTVREWRLRVVSRAGAPGRAWQRLVARHPELALKTGRRYDVRSDSCGG